MSIEAPATSADMEKIFENARLAEETGLLPEGLPVKEKATRMKRDYSVDYQRTIELLEYDANTTTADIQAALRCRPKYAVTLRREAAKELGGRASEKRAKDIIKQQLVVLGKSEMVDTPELVVDENDPDTWLKAQLMTLYEAVMKSARGGNATSQSHILKILGKLDEKVEVTIGLSPDERARRQLEATKQLRKGGY